MATDDRTPIGYWLKHLDRLIDSSFDQTLGQPSLTRRHWQTLNSLSERPRDRAGLLEVLRPFWTEGTIDVVDQVTDDLVQRGWIVSAADGSYSLTPAGHSAHTTLAEQVYATRRRVRDGVTDQEYLATVGVLRRMAANLEVPALQASRRFFEKS
jgi:DNA-binding MarR family transcriptional regulator